MSASAVAAKAAERLLRRTKLSLLNGNSQGSGFRLPELEEEGGLIAAAVCRRLRDHRFPQRAVCPASATSRVPIGCAPRWPPPSPDLTGRPAASHVPHQCRAGSAAAWRKSVAEPGWACCSAMKTMPILVPNFTCRVGFFHIKISLLSHEDSAYLQALLTIFSNRNMLKCIEWHTSLTGRTP